MNHGNLPPAQKNPDEVHNNGYAARLVGAVNQFMAKGPQGVSPQLEQLHPEGYADDGDAHQQTHDVIDDGDEDTAKNKPEYVAEQTHIGDYYLIACFMRLRTYSY